MTESKIFYSAGVGYSNSEEETTVEIIEWVIYKETERGYWVTPKGMLMYTDERNYKKNCKWIPNRELTMYTSRKIKSTKEIAISSLRMRLKKRISWYKYWIKECEKGLEIIEKNPIPIDKPYTMRLDDCI